MNTDILLKIQELLAEIMRLLGLYKEEEQAPVKSRLQDLCIAIKLHEGWFPGSRSQRNNNPGNCRYSSVGYLPIYGEVRKDKDNFAIFKDYATGFLYLQNLVKDKVKKNPTWDFYAFFSNYAPDSDGNNSKQYAETVAKRLGVPSTTKLSSIV